MSLTSRFKRNVDVLTRTVDGTITLDYKNPKLYKKLLRYYRDQGVEFNEDPYDTYELIVDLIEKDLEKEGVSIDDI